MGNKGAKPQTDAQKFCEPTGAVYKGSHWKSATIRSMILSDKLAPCHPGSEEELDGLEECPICFLFYPGGLNSTSCCKQIICTECFLQVQTPSSASPCPFCGQKTFSVLYAGSKSIEEVIRKREEERRVEEMESRSRARSSSSTGFGSPLSTASTPRLVPASERKTLNDELARQAFELSFEQAALPPSAAASASTGTSSRSLRGGLHGMEAFLGTGHSALRAMGNDLAAIEEMMLQEVMRQSLLEAEAAGADPGSDDDDETEESGGRISAGAGRGSGSGGGGGGGGGERGGSLSASQLHTGDGLPGGGASSRDASTPRTAPSSVLGGLRGLRLSSGPSSPSSSPRASATPGHRRGPSWEELLAATGLDDDAVLRMPPSSGVAAGTSSGGGGGGGSSGALPPRAPPRTSSLDASGSAAPAPDGGLPPAGRNSDGTFFSPILAATAAPDPSSGDGSGGDGCISPLDLGSHSKP